MPGEVGVGPWPLFLPADPKPTLSQSRVSPSPEPCPPTRLTTVPAPRGPGRLWPTSEKSDTPSGSLCSADTKCQVSPRGPCLGHIPVSPRHHSVNPPSRPCELATSWHSPLALDDVTTGSLGFPWWGAAGLGGAEARPSLPLVGREDLRGRGGGCRGACPVPCHTSDPQISRTSRRTAGGPPCSSWSVALRGQGGPQGTGRPVLGGGGGGWGAGNAHAWPFVPLPSEARQNYSYRRKRGAQQSAWPRGEPGPIPTTCRRLRESHSPTKLRRLTMATGSQHPGVYSTQLFQRPPTSLQVPPSQCSPPPPPPLLRGPRAAAQQQSRLMPSAHPGPSAPHSSASGPQRPPGPSPGGSGPPPHPRWDGTQCFTTPVSAGSGAGGSARPHVNRTP